MTKEEFRERVLREQRLRKKKELEHQREIERQADGYEIEKFAKLKRRARQRRA